MRASYTVGALNTLLENGIHFNNVYGVSAGASNAVNYVSLDRERSWKTFTRLADHPEFGDLGTFLRHKGFFNSQFIYREAGLPEGAFPFDMESFLANHAKVTIEGFDRDTGETLYWTKNDLSTLEDLMIRVQASSSLPLVMVPTKVGDRWCYDGGLGEGAGLMIAKAQADGFKRFFVVCTRPRGYRKKETSSSLVNALFWRRPHVQHALATRPRRYNQELDKLDKLEAEGNAYVFFSEKQSCESGENNSKKLMQNYQNGYEQAQRELDAWAEFLGI